MTTPSPMTTTRRLNCIPLNDLHVPAAPMYAPTIAITTNTNYYDLKIGSQTPYYTRRCTSYHYYYYYYAHGIIVPVKNTRSLSVCFLPTFFGLVDLSTILISP